jgi:hypothetical protein
MLSTGCDMARLLRREIHEAEHRHCCNVGSVVHDDELLYSLTSQQSREYSFDVSLSAAHASMR